MQGTAMRLGHVKKRHGRGLGKEHGDARTGARTLRRGGAWRRCVTRERRGTVALERGREWRGHGVAAGSEARLCGGGGELGGARAQAWASFGVAWRLRNGDVCMMR